MVDQADDSGIDVVNEQHLLLRCVACVYYSWLTYWSSALILGMADKLLDVLGVFDMAFHFGEIGLGCTIQLCTRDL